jgi:hypothetical protein
MTFRTFLSPKYFRREHPFFNVLRQSTLHFQTLVLTVVNKGLNMKAIALLIDSMND